jgi:hypothetical protein
VLSVVPIDQLILRADREARRQRVEMHIVIVIVMPVKEHPLSKGRCENQERQQ